MKLLKKFSKGIIAVVLCLLLATTALAAATVTYTATLDDDVLCVNELTGGKTVTLTAQVDEKVLMDAFTAQVKVPDGWKITGIANANLNFGEGNYNLENGMILWYSEEATEVENALLATVAIEVPADTKAGEYEIVFELIDISREYGMPWEDGEVLTAKLTVADHADGDDADHLCDTCQGAVEGENCVYVPGEYVWSEDYSSCTVVGTCACGETATATAEVTSAVTTTGTCQTAEVVTYTADFAEDWAEDQTKAVTGEMNPDVHVGEQKTEYINNGENHTVKVSYTGCGHVVSETTEGHTYVDGKCVCGAEENETPEDPIDPDPTDPDPSEPVGGLKGDLDLDGDVDAFDLTLLARHVGGIELLTDAEALKNADVNGDDTIDANDLTKHARFIGGIITDWNED